jgi:molybdopterin synthase sulfur carrier subunit
MIHLRYFASLRERLGVADEQISLPEAVTDIAGLRRWLQGRPGIWNEALADGRLQVAINQTIAPRDAPVCDGDEIAWFPPMTGG